MSINFLNWAIILILSLSITGLGIRYLAEHNVPLSESLIARGLTCLLVVVVWARARRLPLMPKSIKTQCFRALIAGLALTLFTLSYQWLSASTVAVLSNIDVPMMVILGSWVGQRSTSRAKILSIASIVVLVFYCLHLHQQTQWLYGLSSLALGTFLLCFGYFFIKKSMHDENAAITVLTPSLAIIFYGLGQRGGTEWLSSSWNIDSVLVCVSTGLGMFSAYFATMKLYRLTDIATAEFPTLIASIAIQPIEALIFNEKLVASNLWLSMLFVGITYLILNSNKTKLEDCHAK